jgi:hypothetical protein
MQQEGAVRRRGKSGEVRMSRGCGNGEAGRTDLKEIFENGRVKKARATSIRDVLNLQIPTRRVFPF